MIVLSFGTKHEAMGDPRRWPRAMVDTLGFRVTLALVIPDVGTRRFGKDGRIGNRIECNRRVLYRLAAHYE